MFEAKKIGSDYDYLFKIVLFGNDKSGKSSLINRYTKDSFSDEYKKTGLEWDAFKSVQLEDMKEKINLQICEAPTNQKETSHLRGNHANFFIFDFSDKQSFEWVQKKYLDNKYNTSALSVLVGNKSDLKDTVEESFDEEIEEFVQNNNLIYIETSAKENINIDYLFEITAKNIYVKWQHASYLVKAKNFCEDYENQIKKPSKEAAQLMNDIKVILQDKYSKIADKIDNIYNKIGEFYEERKASKNSSLSFFSREPKGKAFSMLENEYKMLLSKKPKLVNPVTSLESSIIQKVAANPYEYGFFVAKENGMLSTDVVEKIEEKMPVHLHQSAPGKN